MTRARLRANFAAFLAVMLLAAAALWLLAAPIANASDLPWTVQDPARNQTDPPSAPANLRVEHTDEGSRMRWDDPNDTSITGYELRLRI